MSFVYVYIISMAYTVHLYTMFFEEVSNDKIIVEVCENSTLECFSKFLEAGFYGKRHLHVKGGLKGGKGWGKGPSKGEISRQRREEEMEKNAREVLANIKSKKGADVPEISGADAADADASETSPPDADVALPKKGAHEESDSKGDGKGKGKNGKKGDGKGKHKKEARIERWWTKIDGDCPISLVPIAELPVPPFGLKADGSSVPHYFDGRFLASFLLSSFDFINPVNRTPLSREDCVALDAHLRDYPDRGVARSASQGNVTDAFDLFQRNGGTGTDAVRREATAVFQHLFRFTHSQNLDSRGRAINFNDGGLTVPWQELISMDRLFCSRSWTMLDCTWI